MLRRTKAKLRSLLADPVADASAQDPEIEKVVNEQLGTLSQSRIKVQRSRAEIEQNGLTVDAPFADFLGHYSRLNAAAKDMTSSEAAQQQTLLVKQRTEHRFLSDFAALAISFLSKCEELPPTLVPLLKRHFYRFISILNSKDSSRIFEYKKGLPRQFVIDALAGMADIVDMEPGKMVEQVWRLKQYNFDYALYQKTLTERVAHEISMFDETFVAHFPSKEWLVKELCASLQYQWALVELLKLKYFDLIFLGAGEVPLGMALYDAPPEILPPVVALCHGIPSGDPIMGFFTRYDHVIVRCEPEKEFYADLGVPSERMLEVGSSSAEDFPSKKALDHGRLNARYKLGLDESDTVLLYATTYDISIYDTKSCDEILQLMIDSFGEAEKLGLKNAVLYIKYHPSPSSDPVFSYSRSQYPLQAFAKLTELGYRVRLADSIEDILPACDCFIAHESSTLTDALDFGVPTISIKMHNGLSKPLLGSRAYEETDCHKHLSVYDSAATLGGHMHALTAMDREVVYEQSQTLWKAIFKSGRTVGLMKIAALVEQLVGKKAP